MKGVWRWAGIGTLSLAAFVLSHQLMFLATYGSRFDSALRATGHGAVWNDTLLVVVLLSMSLLIAACFGLARLVRRARALSASGIRVADEHPRVLARLTVRMWVSIALIAGAIFVVNENLERLSVREPLPGLSVLGGSGDANPVLILLVVAFLAAIVGALFQWRRAVLSERIRVARARLRLRLRPQSSPKQKPRWADLRPEAHIGRNLAGRAPPHPASA